MRTSPIHYIAPSAISITPNANGSQRDLAVYIARNTKIRVCYQPISELGYNNANYKEWSLRGRNRRLTEWGVPYTIYARLNKTDQDDGYLVFSKQIRDNSSGEWRDPYILTPNTSTTSAVRLTGADGQKYQWGPISDRQAANGRSGYWWIKIGEVTVSDDDGEFSVSLDTGILGTDQYNMDWYLNPDGMPERPVREIMVERGEWTVTPMAKYTGETGAMIPDGTLNADIALYLGWTGSEELSFTSGQEIAEPYHFRGLTRDRWLTHRLSKYEAGYSDAELYKKLTSPVSGWGEENWVETSHVWRNGKLWECLVEGTTDEPSENSRAWKMLLQSGMDGESGYDVALTKSSDSAIIDPSGNVVGGYRTVSKDSSQREYYSYRFFTSVTVMKGENYLHLCGAMDDDEELGEGNFTIEAIGAGCDLKMEGTTCYITGIWHCNDGNAETPNTSYSENPEEYQLMRAMAECVAHITLNIEGKTAVTKDYRLQLVHLPTDTVVVESHNEVAAVNWSTKKNAWTNTDSIVIPLTAASGGQPVMFQTVNGETGPDIRLLNKPTWLSGTHGFTLAWADYKDGAGNVLFPASQHMAVEITIPIANIRKNQDIKTSNLLRFNVVTTVDGVEYENIVPFTLNMTTDKAVYVLAPSVRQVVGTMIGGTWDAQTNTVVNARYSYSANGAACNNVSCRLMSYDENNALTEITNDSDIHDNVTFLLNGQPSSLAAFRTGLANTAVSGKNHNLFDELSEIVFAIRLDGNDYESEGVPILRNGAQLTVGSDGYWYIGGVKTEVFAKGTEVVSSKIYYTDPMSDSTPPAYAPTDAQRGNPVSPYLKTQCPASVEGKFIHYVSITIFSDSDKTYVYNYGTIGTGNTVTVIQDRDYYASPTELNENQLKSVVESKWSESTPDDYNAYNKYLYARDTARYYKNGAEQNVTVGGISYPKIVYNLLSYWGQDGSGVEFAYYRANDESAANKPSVSVLNQRHPGTAKNPVIADWSGSDGGWYDDNPGFTAMGQVMYQSVNKYSNGTWSGWGDPVIIDRYAENGKDGNGMALAIIRNDMSEEQWTAWAIIGQTQFVNKRAGDDDFTNCRVGDIFTVSGTASNSGKRHTSTWRCTAVNANQITGVCISHTADGDKGGAGHVGRWYYYAGDWQDQNYYMQETQAPFVKRGDSFYMLDWGTDGRSTGTTSADPATHHNPVSGQGSEPWTLMQSTMQYYIAQAFFGPYAHFGSFIINGDWLISQQGTVNGTYSEAYTSFNTAHPFDNIGNNFIPNFAVDGRTGKTYQNDAYVRGKVYATEGEFRGTVYAEDGEFTGKIKATGGFFKGENSNGFSINFDADDRKFSIKGPSSVKNVSTLAPATGSVEVEYVSIGRFAEAHGYSQWHDGERQYFIQSDIRLYRPGTTDNYYGMMAQLDTTDGLIFKSIHKVQGETSKSWYGPGSMGVDGGVIYIDNIPDYIKNRNLVNVGQVYLDGETLKVRLT